MNVFKGLLFLHGHFVRPEDVEPAGDEAPSPAPARNPLADLRFLGGRPMHAGHNFDVEEPFDPPAVEPQREPACCG